MSLFVNYRRDDSQWVAGRLHDVLIRALPDVEIFRDIDNIEPGEDFVEVIEKTLDTVKVVLGATCR